LTEFHVDDKQIEDGLDLADHYLKKLKKEAFELERIKFDRKLMELSLRGTKQAMKLAYWARLSTSRLVSISKTSKKFN
jgi:hypothetical protein